MTRSVPNAETLRVHWTTSSYSGGGNNCVQAAPLGSGPIAVRDSKNPTGPALLFTSDAWHAFLTAVRTRELRAL